MSKEDILDVLEGCWEFVTFLLMLPLITLTELCRETVMRGAKGRAKRGLTPEQCQLLDDLWQLDEEYEYYVELKGGYLSTKFFTMCDRKLQRIDQKIAECRQAHIDEKQILAFRVATHNYWWQAHNLLP